MDTKGTHDRMALIDRLEKKYSHKFLFQKLRKQEKNTKRSPHVIGNTSDDDYVEYVSTDIVLPSGRRLAY